MIRKTKEGWIVVSEAGKRLSRPYQSRNQAVSRLRQIEYFKHRKK